MMTKVRINLVNPKELLELSGIGPTEADAIIALRAQDGPIRDASEPAGIVGGSRVTAAIEARVDFPPAETIAPEAPGA